jgi:ribosome-associated toxin RatA of RatAB toxin-antitoxin module
MNSGIIDYNSFIMIIKKIELYKDNEEKLINNINKSLGLLSSYYSGNNSKNIKNKIRRNLRHGKGII